MAGLDPSRVAWFEDCAPSLLTNRTVRNYLSSFSQQQWPEVIKFTLIYGIIALQQQHPGRILTLQQLKQVVQASAATLVVQRNVPQLQRQILNLQSDLDSVFDRLAVEPLQPASSPQQAAAQPAQQQALSQAVEGQPTRLQQQQRQVQFAEPAEQPLQQAGASASPAAHGRQRRRHVRNAVVVAPKPSGAWRQGEPSGFTSPPRCHPMRRSQDNQGATNPIYPDWWLAEQPAQQPAQQQQPAKPPRQQPRLAYSVSQQQPQQSVADDDLVTAEYLVVPSSGYGQQQQPLVPGEGPPIITSTITPNSITTSYIGQQQEVGPRQQQQHQQPRGAGVVAAGAKGAAGKPAAGGISRAARVKKVESKIKQQVAASRAQAAARQQHRQQLLSSVVATTGMSGRDQVQQQQDAVEATCLPAAAAEQFISNPWTSWFLPGSAPDLSAGMLAAAPGALAAAGRSYSGEHVGASMAGTFQAELKAAAAGAEGDTFELVEKSIMTIVSPPEQAAGQAAGVEQTAAEPARGILQDITTGLNQFAGSSSSASITAEQVGWFDELGKPRAPPLGFSAAAEARLGAQEDAAGGFMLYCQAAGMSQYDLAGQQQGPGRQHEQQQQKQQKQRKAWAADFGHLDSPRLIEVPNSIQGPDGAASAAQRPHQKHHRQLWSQKWVGEFGHLEGPRFGKETAFSHHQLQQQEEQEAAEGGSGSSTAAAQAGRGFMMSPTDLEALVAAADRVASHSAAASPAADAKHAGLARTAGLSEGTAAPAASTAAARRGIGMQLSSLLQQWEQRKSTGDGGESDAEYTAPLTGTAAPQAQPHAAAAGSIAASRDGSPGRVRLHGDVQLTGSPTKREQAAADPAAELAEDYLEGLTDTSRMLQQALQQHGSVMKLLAALDSPTQAEDDQHQQEDASYDVYAWQEMGGDAESQVGGGACSSAAHTAAWVAATSAVEDDGHERLDAY